MAETTDESRSTRLGELPGLFLSFPNANDDNLEMLSFETPD